MEIGEVTYPKHIESLQKDLRKVIAFTEAHTIREQKHQADVNNKRAKGSRIKTGDKVLMAKKGERSYRKVADKWRVSTLWWTANHRLTSTRTGTLRLDS